MKTQNKFNFKSNFLGVLREFSWRRDLFSCLLPMLSEHEPIKKLDKNNSIINNKLLHEKQMVFQRERVFHDSFPASSIPYKEENSKHFDSFALEPSTPWYLVRIFVFGKEMWKVFLGSFSSKTLRGLQSEIRGKNSARKVMTKW